jgi:hypothetical protein
MVAGVNNAGLPSVTTCVPSVPRALPDGWALEGLWFSRGGDDVYVDRLDREREFSDREIGESHHQVVSFISEDKESPDYVTIHGVDDWESLSDILESLDPNSYFEN